MVFSDALRWSRLNIIIVIPPYYLHHHYPRGNIILELRKNGPSSIQ